MKKRETSLKSILFEPVAPYYADALNTLSSVVQALALGIYGFEITESFFKDDVNCSIFTIIEFIIMFFVVCVLWHRYISHNQLYAWRLGALDTIIPVTFGLLEVFLILTIQIKDHNLLKFSFGFSCLTTWGLIAYLNTHYKFKSRIAQITYKEHFNKYGKDFAQDIFDEVRAFEDKSLRELALAVVLMWECFAMIFLETYPEKIELIIFGILSGLILGHLLYDNVWRHLIKSNKLKTYPIWRDV